MTHRRANVASARRRACRQPLCRRAPGHRAREHLGLADQESGIGSAAVNPISTTGYLRTQPRRTHGASATACTASPSRCSGSDSVWATRPLHSQALNAATAAAPAISNG